MISPREYLVAVGRAASLGRFVSRPTFQAARGLEVIVRTERGLEVGAILRPAAAGEVVLPYRPPPGEIVRPVNAEDRRTLEQLANQAENVLEQAQQLAGELELPIQVVDAEPLLEPQAFLLHFLRFGAADLRPWTSRLAGTYEAFIYLYDLTDPHAAKREEENHACGSCTSGGCGSCGDGGDCGSGGGCGSGCGAAPPEQFQGDWQAYFAELREHLDRRIRLPM